LADALSLAKLAALPSDFLVFTITSENYSKIREKVKYVKKEIKKQGKKEKVNKAIVEDEEGVKIVFFSNFRLSLAYVSICPNIIPCNN